jgi:hypothetical protein
LPRAPYSAPLATHPTPKTKRAAIRKGSPLARSKYFGSRWSILFELSASLREWRKGGCVSRCDGLLLDEIGTRPRETARSVIPHLGAQALHTSWRYSPRVDAVTSAVYFGRRLRHFESRPESKAASSSAACERYANVSWSPIGEPRRRARLFGNPPYRCADGAELPTAAIENRATRAEHPA